MAEEENFSRTLDSGSEALFDHECTDCRAHGSTQEATDFCQDCKTFLCKICWIHHIRNKKKHTLVSVASLKQPKTLIPTASPTLHTRCQYHPDRDVKIYCGTHDMVYCFRCIANEHRLCSDVKEIEDVAHKSKMSELQLLVAKITRVNTELHSTKSKMSNDLKLIQNTRTSLLDEIKVLRKQFNNYLDELEQKLTAELDEEQIKLEKEILDDMTTVDELKIASDICKQDITPYLDEKQIFITEKLGQAAIVKANKFLKKAKVLKYPTLKFEPNEILCAAIEKSDRLGDINRIDTRQRSVQRINVINVRMSSDKQTCHINDVCQLADGTVLLIDCTNNKLKRLDDKLNVKDFLDLNKPIGLCSVSPTEVAVRLRDKTIHFISVGESLTHNRNVSLNKFTNADCGMACCNNQLWIPGHQAVYVYSHSGALVKKIETNSQNRRIFPRCNPEHIAVSDDETKVYVAAWENRVVVFDNNGDVIQELRNQRLNETRGICITEDDVVLVAGRWSKNVVMFDRDGNGLGELVAGKNMLTNPLSLSYDSTQRRLFIGYSGDKAQLFKLS